MRCPGCGQEAGWLERCPYCGTLLPRVGGAAATAGSRRDRGSTWQATFRGKQGRNDGRPRDGGSSAGPGRRDRPVRSFWRNLLAALALAYILMPFDLRPDLIPVLGWLDDFLVGLLAWYLWRGRGQGR